MNKGGTQESAGVKFDMGEAIDRFGSDAFRYFLLREVPFGQDGSYSAEAIDGKLGRAALKISDDELRESIELNQLKKMRERGSDLVGLEYAGPYDHLEAAQSSFVTLKIGTPTAEIQTGQRVRVDGSNGVVTILDS